MPNQRDRSALFRSRVLGVLAWTAGAVGAASAAAAATEASPVTWSGIERVVAFADVHGAHAELTALLQSVGVVDAELRWTGGKTHLVSLGDLLDRGADSRRVMDLLMRLQREAEAAGGRVHVVLGNHEAMNVLGDLRYVAADEFAPYAADEDPDERSRQRDAFLSRQSGTTVADFERLFPPGFFAHRRLLGPQGPYGQWLLGLPAVVRINDTVYMHGGPSTLLQGRGIETLNRDYAAAVNEYLVAESTLRAARPGRVRGRLRPPCGGRRCPIAGDAGRRRTRRAGAGRRAVPRRRRRPAARAHRSQLVPGRRVLQRVRRGGRAASRSCSRSVRGAW